MTKTHARAARVDCDVQPDGGKESRSLKSRWQKAARRLRRFRALGLATVTMAFGGCATARTLETDIATRPVPTAIVETAMPQAAVRDTVAVSRLDTIFTKINATETGRTLLTFARDNKIDIRLSDSKHMDDDPNDGIFVQGLNHYTFIELNNETKSDDMLMLTLAHEIRHSWHKRVVKVRDLHLDPKRQWISDRVQEADCFAYEVHFGYEYEHATGKSLDPDARRGGYGALATYYAKLRDSGMAAPDAYRLLLEKAFVHTHGLKYDEDFLKSQLDRWNSVVEKPVMGILYAKDWDDPTTDADFAAAMRRVTTVGLDPVIDTSGLKAWQDADFLKLDKTGGAAADDLVRLATAETKFAEAKTAWQDYWKSVIEKKPAPQAAPQVAPHIELRPVPLPPVNPPGLKP